jgi:hypothetical protein
MKKSAASFLLFLLLAPVLSNLFAENKSNREIAAERVSEKITIDGILNESIWQKPGYRGLQQQEPRQGENPTYDSEMWFAYDDAAVYFAARFYDSSPDSILARLVRRDFVWGDPSDGCVFYLDSYNDNRNGYYFYVSAAGTLADGTLENDEKQTDISWDAVWEGAPRIDEKGWTVEMRIPYSQLRFKPGSEQTWGVNVERYLSRKAETDMLAYTPRNESGFASRFPKLIGIKGITPPARVEILPYATGKAEYIGNSPEDPFNDGKKYSPGLGLDLKMGLGPNLTLDGTVNPDFGQVEVDPAVVNLTDVESSFDEKRPFFTEGVGIFRFGQGGCNNFQAFNWNSPNLFYSRRIGRAPQGPLPAYDYADIPAGTHILGAGKITGQLFDNWKIGTIHALTEREYASIDAGDRRSELEIEPLTYYGVFRAQRDFDNGARGIGFLSTITSRLFKDDALRGYINKDALMFAADGWTFFDSERTYVLTGWLAASRINGNRERMIAAQRSPGHYFQRPDASYLGVDSSASSLSGYAGRFVINKNRGRFSFNAAFGFLSPKFEINDLGYSAYSDVINAHLFSVYRWTTPTDFYQNAGINAAAYVNYDFGGNKTAEGYRIGGYINLKDLSGGNFAVSYSPASLNSRRTRGGPLTVNPVSRYYNFNAYSDNRLWWVINLGANYRYNDDAEQLAMYTTFELKVSPTLTIQFGPQLNKDLFNAQWITAYNDKYAVNTYNKRYIFARLDQTTVAADIRVDWIINPRLSFQVYIQPLISAGKYSSFKNLTQSKSYTFTKYGEGGSSLEKIEQGNGGFYYLLDSDGSGPAEAAAIGNPDFNFISLRGNAVLRWEYRPGSCIYLVWTQSRANINSDGNFYFGQSMRDMFDIKPDNIFMVKFTYWFGL